MTAYIPNRVAHSLNDESSWQGPRTFSTFCNSPRRMVLQVISSDCMDSIQSLVSDEFKASSVLFGYSGKCSSSNVAMYAAGDGE